MRPDDETDPEDAGDRLTTLETSWSMLRTAHTSGPAGQAAMRDLIGRYHDAVERYLRLKLRDRNLADEVFQEFWTKLLDHKLAGADHSKGRFRDYLRTVLHRLIVDHFRGRKLQPLPPGDLLDPSAPDVEYDRVWREAIIRRVWSRLETYEAGTPKNRYATVLHLRVENPDASIEEIAAILAEQVGARVTPEAFRKTLQRARGKFLELLIEELRVTIHPATPEDIEAEIYDLGLGNLYRRYSAETE
jgi:RNA polymerase sigma-70 factor (ECF subfamily)